MTNYILEVKPALPVKKRHELEDKLKEMGYKVSGGGQMMDGSLSDISFEDKDVSVR